jgi:hypothetical protein
MYTQNIYSFPDRQRLLLPPILDIITWQLWHQFPASELEDAPWDAEYPDSSEKMELEDDVRVSVNCGLECKAGAIIASSGSPC